MGVIVAGCGTGKTCPCMVQAHTYPALDGGRALSVMCTYTMWSAGDTVASSVTEMMLIGNAAADAI